MSDSADTSKTAVKTYVPAYQKAEWESHADELDMSQSEFVRTMVQAGRRGFESGSAEPDSSDPDPGGSGLETQVLELLSTDTYSWDELLEAVADDIESRLDETLRSCSRKTGFDTADATVGIRLPTVVTMATEPGTDTPSDVTDPIEYFLDDQRYHGKSERTLEAYERVLRRFEAFVRERFDVEAVGAAQRRECMAWIHSLRGEFESGYDRDLRLVSQSVLRLHDPRRRLRRQPDGAGHGGDVRIDRYEPDETRHLGQRNAIVRRRDRPSPRAGRRRYPLEDRDARRRTV